MLPVASGPAQGIRLLPVLKRWRGSSLGVPPTKTYLGRVIRDIARKIDRDPGLETKFAWLLSLARRVRAQEPGQRGPMVYSLHAPEVECKGKPHKPYEFGVKVSVATTLKHSKGACRPRAGAAGQSL